MDDLNLAALLGNVTPGPDAQIEAMRRMGLLGQLSGDRVLAPVGQGLEQQAQQQQRLAVESARNQAIAQHRLTLEKIAQDRLNRPPTPVQEANADAALVRSGQAPRFGPRPAPGLDQVLDAGGPPAPTTAGAPLRRGRAPKAPPKAPEIALSPEALDIAAEQAFRTGKVPNFGMGAQGAAIKLAILERVAKLHPGADLAGNSAGYTSDTASLKKQQQLLDLTKSWEATGKANLGVLREVSTQLVNSGVPWLNGPIRTMFQKGKGDPVVTKFKAAHAAVVNEYAKILSGATGSAGVTDAARREAEEMLPLDSTPAQIAAAADLLETDAGNRLKALEDQTRATKERTTAKGASAEPPVEGKIKVKRKSDGKVGSMPAANFNPDLYEKL